MVDALARLMEEGRFTRCLATAEQLVDQGGWSPSELAAIHLISCRCRLATHDAYGAVMAGLSAVRLARQEGEYDLLGRALLNLGTAYVALQQYEQALRIFCSYFDYLDHYREARRLEGAVWKHIGVAYQRQMASDEAIAALGRARQWFAQHRIEYSTFTCTHDLINIFLHQAEEDGAKLAEVRRLLAEQRAIAGRHPSETYFEGTYLLDLAACLQREGRLARAKVAVTRALEVHQGDRMHAFHCHLLLHRCELQAGDWRKALGHGLAAWAQAVEAHHPDLERLAAQALVEVVEREGPEILQELDAEYQAIGVDLGAYLGPWMARRELQ